LWLKDDRVRTLILEAKKRGFALRLKDEQYELPEIEQEGKVHYSTPPKSLKLKLVYNENSRQMRILYGLNGTEASTEMPESMAGIYFGEPLTESAAIFLLFSSGSMDIDHYEIKPMPAK